MTVLAQKVRKSIFFVFLSVFTARAISFGTQILLARLLAPTDFGFIAIALMLINFFYLFQYMGIGEALVYEKKNIRESCNTAVLLLFLFSLGMGALIFFSAPLIAAFFDTDREILTKIIRALVFVLLFKSLFAVPNVLFEKELEFEKKLKIEIIPAICYAVVTLSLALSNYGVWSLVFGHIFSAFITIPIVWKISQFRPSFRFDFSIAKKLLSYGKFVAFGAIASFVVVNVDDVVVGKLLTFKALGYYYMAFTVSNLVVINVSQVINRVAFPTYVKVSDNISDTKKIFLLTARYISIIAAPFTMILITQGHDLTRIFLGEKWLPMVPVMQIACLSSFMRALFSNTGSLFNGLGVPQYLFYLNLTQIVLLLIFLIPLTKLYGVFGTACGVLFTGLIIVLILLKILKETIDMKTSEFLKVIAPAICASLVAGLLNIFWIHLIAPMMGIHTFFFWMTFITLFCVAAIFFFLLYFLNKKIIMEMYSFIKGEHVF